MNLVILNAALVVAVRQGVWAGEWFGWVACAALESGFIGVAVAAFVADGTGDRSSHPSGEVVTDRGPSAQANDAIVDRYNEGVTLWDTDRIPEAIAAFRDAARSGDEEATYALGRSLLWNGEVEEAVPLLSRVSAASGAFADLAAGELGRHLLGSGTDVTRAVSLLGQAASSRREYRSDYAQALALCGRHDEAISLLRREVKRGSVDAPIVLGNIYLNLGDESSAEGAYRVGFRRGDAHSAYNLAALLADRGELSASREWLRAAAKGGDQRAVDRLAAAD